jgi:hypothetical protein
LSAQKVEAEEPRRGREDRFSGSRYFDDVIGGRSDGHAPT